jgi:hypothetical protein
MALAGTSYHTTPKGPVMTQPLSLASILPETGAQSIVRSERQSERPPLTEETRRHRLLTEALSAQREQAEAALVAYQVALARRWACEVAAQRAYRAAQRRLAAQRGADPSEPFTPARPGADSTPRGLLDEVRRIADVLELLAPRPSFPAETRTELCAVADELATAIAQSEACGAERRRLVSAERVVARLLEQAERRAEQLQAQG